MKIFKNPILLIIVGLAVLWTFGFVSFITDITALREPGVQPGLEAADAIVVLTGGSERLTTGIELLESGNAKKLFISGVHKNLSLDGILGSLQVPSDLRNCCIILGYQAGSTLGNAEETRDWLHQEGYHSLRLVTANYHMPRSLLLFHTIMPDVTIIPYPITPDSVKLYQWWIHPHTIALLAFEYDKFLMAHLKIWLNGNQP